MANGVNVQRVGRFFGEANSIIADAQTIFFRFALQLLDVAFSRLRKPMKSSKDSHGRFAVDAANVGTRGS